MSVHPHARSFVVFLLLLMTLGQPALATQSLKPAEAIDMAGRQRMLSQRMSKAYLQLALNTRVEIAREQVDADSKLFREQLRKLRMLAAGEEVAKALQEVERLWAEYQRLLASEPDRVGVERVLAADERLLAAAHNVVMVLREVYPVELNRLVDMAGRQRMLAQRAAKLYLAEAYGLRGARLDDELQQTVNEFTGGLSELQRARQNTDEIVQRLRRVDDQWHLFRRAVQGSSEPSPYMTSLMADRVVDEMEGLIALYTALPGNKPSQR